MLISTLIHPQRVWGHSKEDEDRVSKFWPIKSFIFLYVARYAGIGSLPGQPLSSIPCSGSRTISELLISQNTTWMSQSTRKSSLCLYESRFGLKHLSKESKLCIVRGRRTTASAHNSVAFAAPATDASLCHEAISGKLRDWTSTMAGFIKRSGPSGLAGNFHSISRIEYCASGHI